MAIQVTATKGGFSITDGYLLITSTQMQKFLRPVTITDTVTNEDGSTTQTFRAGVEDAVMWTARGQVYPSKADRDANFGATELNFAFTFAHVDGYDPVSEAYSHIKQNGISGWTLSNMVDA
jgi:hypothetical protein